jgi:hypothetical protein
LENHGLYRGFVYAFVTNCVEDEANKRDIGYSVAK